MAEQVVHFRWLTGDRVAQLIPVDWRFSPRLAGQGSGMFVFAPGDALSARPRSYWQDLRREWSNMLAVVNDGIVEYAGLVVGSDWDPATGRLEIETRQIGAILGRRHAFTVGGWHTGDFGIYDLSLQGAMYAILREAYGKTGQWSGPVTLPPYVFPGTYRKWWPRHEFTTMDEMARQVMTEEGGPDIDFRPFLREDGGLRFEIRTGMPTLPGQTYNVVDGRRQGTAAAKFSRDGIDMLTGVFAIGTGSGEDIAWAEAGGPTLWPDQPFLDKSVAWKTLSGDTLASHAREYLDAHRLPRETVTVTMPVDPPPGMPGPGLMLLGTILRLASPADAVQDAATRDLYVLGLTRRMGQATYEVETRDIEAVL